MAENLQLAVSRNINGVKFNCYTDSKQECNGDFWATREQIVQLLGYADPDASVRNIHHRNKDRLDKFSTRINLIQVEGNREVSREVIV
ncbi:MAG: hypothetical protein IJG36_11815, partial [Synergistaceae bacterium]|nr:hypothetical protein [Synergistaceae bacterium]